MGKDIKCPVCGKADIPDFHNEDVTCPCCGSDLSVYRVIEKIPENGHKTNVWKPISAVAIFVAVGLGLMIYTQKPTVITTPTEEITLLKDSIGVLNTRLAQSDATNKPSSGYNYVVLRGDSYWSISRKFYGTGTRADEVAMHNNRALDTPLIVGDTLIIK